MKFKKVVIYIFAVSCILLFNVNCTAHHIHNVALLGDSNLWIGGDNCENDRSWSHEFKMLLDKQVDGAECYSLARSGATWANTIKTIPDATAYSEILSDDNVIYNQVLRLINRCEKNDSDSPQMIIISCGTNDAWFSDKRPGLFSKTVNDVSDKAYSFADSGPADNTSLIESIFLAVAKLRTAFPDSEIVLVGPPFTIKTSRDKIHKVSETISAAGKHLNVNVIRLDNEDIINDNDERIKFHLTTDGTHTSPAGAVKIANYIYQSLFDN